jgi:hypothetical protein
MDGANATIKGATEQQAGVMTAEMVRLLYEMRDRMAVHLGEAPRVVTIRPGVENAGMTLPPPAGQAQREEILPPADLAHLADRIARLEKSGASLEDVASLMNALTGFRDQVGQRITAIEDRIGALEKTISKPQGLPAPEQDQIWQEIDQLRNAVRELEPIARENAETVQMIRELIDDPTPVLVPEDEE